MNADLQEDFDALWKRIHREAADAKFSHQAVIELSQWYRRADVDAQQLARRELARWLSSSNPAKRFDALALIREFSVSEATRELQELRERLQQEESPDARFELRKVNEVLAGLSNQD